MIGFALAPVDDDAINRGKDRATEADESSGRRCAGDGSPGTGVRGSTAKIHAADVDRVPLASTSTPWLGTGRAGLFWTSHRSVNGSEGAIAPVAGVLSVLTRFSACIRRTRGGRVEGVRSGPSIHKSTLPMP
jgi:hypothetical protein